MRTVKPENIVEICKPFLCCEEEFAAVVLLEKDGKISEVRMLQKGTFSEVCFDTQSVVKQLADCGAFAVVLVHNHPNGKVKPSDYDIKITKKFIEECANINVAVVDHIIVSTNEFFSFANRGVLK